MASLRHPHIVAVLNVFLANNTAYIVMQHERGRNLAELIQQRGSLSMTLTLRIFLPLLDALALMHSRAMLHLDLKPGNIHLRTGHDPLLLDLGAVHLTDNNSSAGSQVVTAGYSPLEQYRRDSNIGPWTDVYAIGATLRCCLEGKPPLPSPERAGNDTQAPAIEALRGRYPTWLLELIDSCMSMEPRRRPQDAGRVLSILQAHQAEAPFATPGGIRGIMRRSGNACRPRRLGRQVPTDLTARPKPSNIADPDHEGDMMPTAHWTVRPTPPTPTPNNQIH